MTTRRYALRDDRWDTSLLNSSAKLKPYSITDTRYDKCAVNVLGAIYLAAQSSGSIDDTP